ncbi:MAG: PaaI family thioesterase [Armatimonadetes bacterium]|nr:PaaI family thioesterase [Armatimonadota bacterium]
MLTDDGGCFACGPRNAFGLHLEFRTVGDEYLTSFTPASHHQGFAGVVHGGILTTVLDEVMARFLWARSIPAVTAEIKVTLRQPARIGEPLTVSGRILRDARRLILCQAEARRADGTVVAAAEGKFVRVGPAPPGGA